jgi:site-specific DNA recombinase
MSRPARRVNGSPAAQPAVTRCAIYTRKSTEEGLDRDINSLSVQRQACEEYVRTRASEGWLVVPEVYDDGGWSGATVKRPGFQRLLADVEAGRVNCVVVHRVDRLSRSLLDFARLMAFFQENGVAFVSVTQNFSTADPVGRLTLNLLATFAEFEREMISARTKDKIAASRRRGRWTGGRVPLGYDLKDGRLVVNEAEAVAVREIFDVYDETSSLTGAVEKLGRCGLAMKAGTQQNGSERSGRSFDKPSLLRVLRNPTYAGLTRCNGSLTQGEHEAIVPGETWQRVQVRLTRNGSAGYQGERENHNALLKGLLHCAQCGSAMTPTYTMKRNTRYRYYRCITTIKKGAHACPSRAVPAHEIERRVVDRIRTIGRDPELLAGTIEQVRRQRDELIVRLEAERHELSRVLRAKKASLRRAKGQTNGESSDPSYGEIDARIREITARLEAIPDENKAARRTTIDEDGIRSALEAFGPVWESLWPAERSRTLKLLIESIDYDGRDEELEIRFRQDRIGSLSDVEPT